MKIKFRQAGFEEIRRSNAVAGQVERAAEIIALRAGKDYVSSGRQGQKGPAPKWNSPRGRGYQGRYRAIVYPNSFRAYYDNARNNRLVKLLGEVQM